MAGWEEFNQTYRPLIVGFALKQGLDAEAAEDGAQDTLLSVARSIGSFTHDPARSTFKNWLFTVARVPDLGSAALDTREEEESRRALLDEAMERLKPQVSTEHFQIFYLSVLKEHPAAQVAAALGVSRATVYAVRHRLGARFKRLVAALRRELG